MRRFAQWVSLVIGAVACNGTPSIPPAPDPDYARECVPPGVDAGRRDGGVECASGEICLQGRCYVACQDDGDCGPREVCASSGACIRGTPSDGGRPDAGPPPSGCDLVTCEAPSVCHPLSLTCVECNEDSVGVPEGEPGHCSPFSTPICDIANGRCAPFAPSQCAPCNSAAACAAPDGSFTGSCVLRETQGAREQVCIGPCTTEGTCPNGLRCDTVTDLVSGAEVRGCVPPIELPCTNWLRGTSSASCYSDADCAPLGATLAVYVDACEGEMPAVEDGGVPTPGVCLQPCGETGHCFDPSVQQCLGSGLALYCRLF